MAAVPDEPRAREGGALGSFNQNHSSPSAASYEAALHALTKGSRRCRQCSIGVDIGSLELRLWGKNLANSQSIIQRPNVASVIEAYTVPPLMIGLTVTKQFR